MPDIMLLRRSKCIKDVRLDKDVGMEPVSLLSARFSTVSWCRLPMSRGIWPEIWLPTRSR